MYQHTRIVWTRGDIGVHVSHRDKEARKDSFPPSKSLRTVSAPLCLRGIPRVILPSLCAMGLMTRGCEVPGSSPVRDHVNTPRPPLGVAPFPHNEGSLQLGKTFSLWPEPADGSVLNTTGAYSLCRHPMYTGLVMFSLGLGFSTGSFTRIALACLLGYVLVSGVLRGETEGQQREGEGGGSVVRFGSCAC